MRVVIRSDASQLIGTGHMMRCLTLAGYLTEAGANVSFVCREWPGDVIHLVAARGYRVHRLPPVAGFDLDEAKPDDYAAWLGVSQTEDAAQTSGALRSEEGVVDWLVMDHYGLDRTWQKLIYSQVDRILVIDDLANRSHECDLLLDQNYYLDLETRYDGLVPKQCRKLLGPQYALLRPEFPQARARLEPKDGRVSRVLIFYGGCDATGETLKTLEALSRLQPQGVTFDVVAGVSNPRRDEIARRCDQITEVRFHPRIDNMAETMLQADLALGGGGTTTWERCYLGLPTITVEVAGNQRVALEALASRGAVWNLGPHHLVTPAHLRGALKRALASPDAVAEAGRAALSIIGPFEVGKECPVAEIMMSLAEKDKA
jgi:UDP-2,4-diacetamido-2,4,6-trideoxy-beta-L-altropyranose hydrolase